MNVSDQDPVVLALDQGTSSTKALLVDRQGAVVASATVPLKSSNPRPGWVEQDANEILAGLVEAVRLLRQQAPMRPIAAIGLSNQRESALVWEAESGRPVGPMLGWQDHRTADRANTLADVADHVRELSGLPLDPMFSALKLEWLLDEVDRDRRRVTAGELHLGTVDSWLVEQLTGEYRTEIGNASRTQLLNVVTGQWDDELCAIFRIPASALPCISASNTPTAPVRGLSLESVRVTGVVGDSHAALFGHGARKPGAVKVTLGTGSSIMGLSDQDVPADSGLVRTIGWQVGESPARAFEGNIASAGATLTWVANLLGCGVGQLEAYAKEATDSTVDIVPAFGGLGAPWWDKKATGTVTGLGFGHDRRHLALAAFESLPLQVTDVLECADHVAGEPIVEILVDGGPTKNDWLMQMLADYSGRAVVRDGIAELSASGAAFMAALGAGVWDEESLAALPIPRTRFEPRLDDAARAGRRERWALAVRKARISE